MSDEKKVSLEERFENIEKIIGSMEHGDITLDEAFDLYKNGLEEIKEANSILNNMEHAMLKLNENDELEEF